MKRILILLLGFALSVSAQQSNTSPIPGAKPDMLSDAELAAQTVVVFNENDIDSIGLASFYAEQRGIPKTNLIPLKTSGREEITRREYDETIAEPLRTIFVERGHWKLTEETSEAGRVAETKIRYVALIRGIPLKIARHDGEYQGDVIEGIEPEIVKQSASAVDSELAILGLWSRRISGVMKNPYFRETQSIHKTELTSQLLVARLDGPTTSDVRRMITDTILAEKTGLRGFAYVDARGLPENDPRIAGLREGERWMYELSEHLRADGMPVILDNGPMLFPDSYPMRQCALYFGWYSESIAGPFAQGGFKFVPGAIAVHIHSYSADSMRSTDRNWCAPLIVRGAAATMGNVYEPFLTLTPYLNVFERRLSEGFTFAEAGHMSVRFLSWMTTWIGDPLYRPFRFRLEGKMQTTNEWDAYRAGVEAWAKPGGSDEAISAAAKRLKSGAIYEGLGLLHFRAGNHGDAQRAFGQARSLYSAPEDRIRVAVHETAAVQAQKGNAAALAFIRQQISTHEASINVSILRLVEASFSPPKKPGTTPATRPLKR